MRLMTEKRVRHLPVVEGEKVLGLVSIGDLVNWIISAQNAASSRWNNTSPAAWRGSNGIEFAAADRSL